jgi:hypothetical protein
VAFWTGVCGLVLCAVLLAGCSQQSSATDDLIHALTETHSAVASSILAIDLYDQQRSTRAVTDTLLGDLAKQAVDAEAALESVSVDSPQLQSDRDAVLAAIQSGVAALFTSRDNFSQHGAVDTADLKSADQQVNEVLNQLRGSR